MQYNQCMKCCSHVFIDSLHDYKGVGFVRYREYNWAVYADVFNEIYLYVQLSRMCIFITK